MARERRGGATRASRGPVDLGRVDRPISVASPAKEGRFLSFLYRAACHLVDRISPDHRPRTKQDVPVAGALRRPPRPIPVAVRCACPGLPLEGDSFFHLAWAVRAGKKSSLVGKCQFSVRAGTDVPAKVLSFEARGGMDRLGEVVI